MYGEIWKEVPNTLGELLVSNMGRVKRNDGPFLSRYVEKTGGFDVFSFETQQYYVHRVVGQAFVPNPEKHYFLRHKNLDKRNNRADNLYWFSTGYRYVGMHADGLAKTFYSLKDVGEFLGVSPTTVSKNLLKKGRYGKNRWVFRRVK